MTIHRVTTRWSGFQGAPGYTSFYFSGEADAATAEASIDAVTDFWSIAGSEVPNNVTLTTSVEVENIDEASGMLTGYATADMAEPERQGVGAGGYSAATGAVIVWGTNTVVRGRRVQGRTFLVPLNSGAYQADGTLESDTISALQNAATGLINSLGPGNLVIWSRPVNGAGGVPAPVVNARVPDMAAVLRSRRD